MPKYVQCTLPTYIYIYNIHVNCTVLSYTILPDIYTIYLCVHCTVLFTLCCTVLHIYIYVKQIHQ